MATGMQTDFDAIVIGAGPAGSASAILLARAGWSVALVEKQRFPRRKVCGECVAASNLALLDALGIGAAFDAAAGPMLRRVALMRRTRTVVAELPAAADPDRRWGRALGRETLDTLLLEQARAAGATVFQPWTVSALEGGRGDHHCSVRCLEPQHAGSTLTLHAPVAIAAHGSWEPLPSGPLPRRRAPRSGDLLAFKANFRGAALAAGLLPVLAFEGGYGGMVLADGGVTTLACCVRRDRLDRLRRAAPGERAGDVVEAMLRRECRGVEVALCGARRDGAWLAAGPLDPGVRVRADDACFKVGNAAGEVHPIIGEGISMALQSAALLAAGLIETRPIGGEAGADWQRQVGTRYAAAWRRAFGTRLHLAAAFAQLAMRPATAAPLQALAARWPGLLTHGARRGGKVRTAVAPATVAAFAAHTSSAAAGASGAALRAAPHHPSTDT